MTGNERKTTWERLNHNHNSHFDGPSRARVAMFARSLSDTQHEVRGQVLVDEAEAWLRAETGRLERQRAAREQGLVQGWSGE